jgi:DNA-binding CsgD family transcriptional regulator
MLLSGRIDEAEVAAQTISQRAVEFPRSRRVQWDQICFAVSGRVAVGAGELKAACELLQPTVERITAAGYATGWSYRFQLPLATALAMRGMVDDATTALAALHARRHPAWRFLDYEFGIASAWVAGAQGAVSEAVSTVLCAAEAARSNGQFAAEVMCLQTAVQFGDVSGAARLGELVSVVEGPRVGLAARFAEALSRDDAAELQRVSEDFEDMGDVIAAVDAAAHAALAFRRADRNGSALTCSARAEELARRCGGALTPALRKSSTPSPFTDREREIVSLIGQGCSTREIAERLTLSPRTVEGHIYRAMVKTGATDRDQLATMLPKR